MRRAVLALVVGLAACGEPSHGDVLEWHHDAGLSVDYLLGASESGPFYHLYPTLHGPATLRAYLPTPLQGAPALFLKACTRRPSGTIARQPDAGLCSPPVPVDRP